MLTRENLIEIFDVLGTPTDGRELVMRARREAPVRKVQSKGGGNVITVMASRKMGRDIRTESRHIEFAAAVDKEYDSCVLEYFPQPTELRLELIDDTTGEIRNITHTPDYLVIRADGICLEEWKTEAKLQRLAEKYPYRYRKASDGTWYAPQIEKRLAEWGLRYRVCSELAIPAKRVENLLHLADYLHPGSEPCPESTLARLQAVLEEHGSVYLAELLAQPLCFDADELLKAVADNLVVADLDREPLAQPHLAKLYRDSTLREFMACDARPGQVPGQEHFLLNIAPGAVFAYGSGTLTIELVDESRLACTLSDGSVRNLTAEWLTEAVRSKRVKVIQGLDAQDWNISRHTQAELAAALRRDVQMHSSNPGVSDRTLRRWDARRNLAKANGGHELLALVPDIASRGNRTPRLDELQLQCIQHIIEEKWVSHEAANYKSCYRHLQVLCEQKGVKPPSYPTFINHVKAVDDTSVTRSRHGKRMAYQLAEFTPHLNVDTPQHGTRPFQYVHIDHTQLDIELISSATGKQLGRPWLSLAIDTYTRRVVGVYLTYSAPSYVSAMMVVRDMVRRFSRLPEFIVVDNGRDFMSHAFETFLLAMGVHLRFRPAGQPRHGAVLERIFGRLNTEYVHNLAGNTKATKNVRMTTGKHLPKNFAEWTLEHMYHGITHWAWDFYDHEEHPALGMSPREMYDRGRAQSGARQQRTILLNEDFLIATCPPVDREGERKVHRQRGVKVNDYLYWHPDFRDPKVAAQRLPVRYDPWDAASVYVRIKDRWVQAQCRNLLTLGQITDAERLALTGEFLRAGGPRDADGKTAQRLEEFMRVFTPAGAMQAAFEREAENKLLYNKLQLASVNPVQTFARTRLTEDIGHQHVRDDDSRTTSLPSVEVPPQAAAPDDLIDFDMF